LLRDNSYINNRIDEIYNHIISILVSGERYYVPRHNKNFYKFWWNEELDATETNRVRKVAGKPPIFDKRQKSRTLYRKQIRGSRNNSTFSYTNDLHEALLRKNGPDVWKC